MKRILSESNVDILAQFAWSELLVAFDFDGTLAPIVPDRDSAYMRPRTKELLALLCAKYPCAVISGRSRADVSARLEGVPVLYTVGNHGLEPSLDALHFEAATQRMKPQLEAALSQQPGVEIEDKRYSLAIHYRKSRIKGAAREAILTAVSLLTEPTRVISGKLVINVLSAGAPHKGIALTELRECHGADTALFVGDDITDEDVFTLDQPGRLLGIRVGKSKSSGAPYFLNNQLEIDALLERLLFLRSRFEGHWKRRETR